MQNSERFLSAFNAIEKSLRTITNTNKGVPFYRVVEAASLLNAVVKRYEIDLKEFADLRNAIVHERTTSYVIAEPHDIVVEKIETISYEIDSPQKVYPAYKRDVIKFEINQSLTDVLRVIRQEQYSQFPIYNGTIFEGLLTENGIANWFARNVEEDIISFSEISVEEVIRYEETTNNYIFVSRDTSMYQAKDYFKSRVDSQSARLDALLITHNGKSSEKLLGIVTAWDVIHTP